LLGYLKVSSTLIPIFKIIVAVSNSKFQFKSNLNSSFYFGITFGLLVLAFTGYNLFKHELTVSSFLFVNTIGVMLSYVFTLRFSCSINVTERTFAIIYYFKDDKNLDISTEDILSFEKHADTVHRYFKKLLLVTSKETFLIRYNISSSSDEDMLKVLTMIVEENKLGLTKVLQ
jgi:hypothetical protein